MYRDKPVPTSSRCQEGNGTCRCDQSCGVPLQTQGPALHVWRGESNEGHFPGPTVSREFLSLSGGLRPVGI